MNRILVLDDIRVGMYVTILNCQKNLPLLKYKGCVLKVNSIKYPYMTVDVCKPYKVNISLCGEHLLLNLKKVELIGLTEEFVKKSLPKVKVVPDPFWKEIDPELLKITDQDIELISKAVEKPKE